MTAENPTQEYQCESCDRWIDRTDAHTVSFPDRGGQVTLPFCDECWDDRKEGWP